MQLIKNAATLYDGAEERPLETRGKRQRESKNMKKRGKELNVK
jgi:hypothetical protein